MKVYNDKGRGFAVRIVKPGEAYGRTGSLVAESTLVEFYDATYAGVVGFDPLGQFVARYNVETFAAHDGPLSLYGGEPVWSLTAGNVVDVQAVMTGSLHTNSTRRTRVVY